MSDIGRINGWRCKDCGEITYCVHIDNGVTPMFLACRASGDTDACKGTGVSLMYPDAPPPAEIVAAVGWEWYRPSLKWARRKGPGMLDHVKQGGLALRPLTDAGRTLLAESVGGETNG